MLIKKNKKIKKFCVILALMLAIALISCEKSEEVYPETRTSSDIYEIDEIKKTEKIDEISEIGKIDKVDEFDYALLYKSKSDEVYPDMEITATNRASCGYTNMSEQGYNNWYYMCLTNGRYEYLTYSDETEGWANGEIKLIGAVMYGNDKSAAVRNFEVNNDGAAVIYGNFKCADNNALAAQVAIYINGTELYRGDLSAGDTIGQYVEQEVTLNTGDSVYFTVTGAGSRVVWTPAVTYENAQNESLYHTTTFEQYYGDVFPYYDDEEHRLYMGFLWSEDARSGNNYHYALEASDNLLTFRNVPEKNNNNIWQRYHWNYWLSRIMDTRDFIDRQKYTYGVRDNFLYHDRENKRYLLIAGCYYTFDGVSQTSDLVIYASDDSIGSSWSKPGNVVSDGYDRNLPECPSLMRIGDRWYAFVSVAYKTAHQVGPLQYWTGDPGVDCMDINWKEKKFAFLDGEDLCAARPTRIGDKVYMWGWIPLTYNRMPWSPWGGYINLPREVVQHKDGSLGGRLDPALSRLLNYGNIYTLNENNFTVITGQALFDKDFLRMQGKDNDVILGTAEYHRNYVTFRADMENSGKVAYIMEQDGHRYEAAIVKENGGTYLKILSPQDISHTVNSTLEITGESVFDVKIVTDGDIIEFFINDEYALTGHTNMTGTGYTAHLYADNTASFKNVSINKLIPYGDI